jgi:hypothetical protein
MTDRARFSAGVALTVVALAFLFWVALTGARWRGGVDVVSAESYPDGRLVLEARSCNGNPELSRLVETERSIEISVVSSWDSLFFGVDDCNDPLEIRLAEPLGDRELIDLRAQQTVRVIEIDPTS